MVDKIHIISKDFYLKHRTTNKLRKILIPRLKFPNISNQFFMTAKGDCFIYIQNLGFLLVPEKSGLDEKILLHDVDSENWYIEKYSNPDVYLTKNYLNAFPNIEIYNTKEWIRDYIGWLRVWNTFTGEDFVFYKTEVKNYYQNSYICKLVTGDKVMFPINIYKANEFNNLMKDILEWT